MSYNHRSAEKAWLKWKEAEEKELRRLGMAEDAIQKLHTYDWDVFKAERNFRRWQSPEEEVNPMAPSSEEGFDIKVDDLLENTENEQLLELLKQTDQLTLSVLVLWIQGYSSQQIAEKTGIDSVAVRKRISRLKKKIKKFFEPVTKRPFPVATK